MRIVLGLNDADIEALRNLREEQGNYYDAILEDAAGRDLTESECGRLDEIMEELDVLAKIEGVIDNQIELDRDAGKENGCGMDA